MNKMKTILMIAGGALLGYGFWKLQGKKKVTAVVAAKPKEIPVTTSVEPSVASSDPMAAAVMNYNTNPGALFSPPITTVSVPGALMSDVITMNMAQQIVGN